MKLVGRYQIIARIGQGAMANVYRAHDPEIQRDLAIKVLNQQFRRDPECVARFLREARAAGSLSHPNIVTIYDVGEAQGFPYIAMELLNGQPLDQAMQARGCFPIADVLNIGSQLADALRYAHELGVVHRDIKPSNIMLCDDGRTVKILDFGIARVADAGCDGAAGDMLKTQVGQVLGTPRYMSPEQALGRPLDGRSDLFSTGVVLYELIAGRPAFTGSSVATLALQITSQDPAAITTTPECPRGLQFIISKLLAKLPAKRFANGAQLVEALRRETIALGSVDTDETSKRLPLHLRFTLLTTAIMAVILTISIAGVLDQQFRAMERVAVASGSSITSFIASNAALHVMENAAVAEHEADWLPVQAFVRTAAADANVSHMMVVDRDGVVRASGDPSLVGTLYARPIGQKLIGDQRGVALSSERTVDGGDSFRFTRPIVYAGRDIGWVDVGVRKDELQAAAGLTRTLLVGLGILMTTVVLGLSFMAGRLILKPVRRLNNALKEASSGNLEFQISHRRRDEFGDLFDNFNKLVASVQPRRESAPQASPDPAAMLRTVISSPAEPQALVTARSARA